MKIKSLKQEISKIKGKKVLLRVDYNVPIEKNKIKDEQKIIASLPTIRFLLRYDCSVIIITHLGRPKGKKVKKDSTEILAKRLNKLLGEKKKSKNLKKISEVKFINSCIGEKVKQTADNLKSRQILFLENLRFHKEEESNNKKFAKSLASLANVYINDAFSVCHRKHASVVAITSYLPSFMGFLIEQEVKNLDKIKTPIKPLITIMGGVKVNTKVDLINNLAKKSEKVLLGGALANNFLVAKGVDVGGSLTDKDSIKTAKTILKKYGNKIILPQDVIVASSLKSKKGLAKQVREVGKKEKILDIGPETLKLYSSYIKKAQTIIWNGPMGLFENENFKQGSLVIARVVASRSTGKAFGVAGGGETLEVLKKSGMMEYMDWISTGGGAMLAYLSDNKMPGLKKIYKK